MTPLHQLFAILHIDPGLIPADLKCAGSLYADAKIIRATITIQTPPAVTARNRETETPSPPAFPLSPLHAFPPSLPDHQSPAESPANQTARRLQDLRQWWTSLKSDHDRARAAGRILGLED